MKLSENVRKAQKDALLEFTLIIQNAAKKKAPYDTGTLRRSITSSFETLSSLRTKIGSPVPYARRRHFENKKNPRIKFYLTNAYKVKVHKYPKIIEKHLDRNL